MRRCDLDGKVVLLMHSQSSEPGALGSAEVT